MVESTVPLRNLSKGDRFRLPSATQVYYKAFYSWSRRQWICLHADSRRQKHFDPSTVVVFLYQA